MIQFPYTDDEIEAYMLLQQLVKLMSVESSAYGPENRQREENIKILKSKYLTIIEKNVPHFTGGSTNYKPSV